jgi:hypothetical protein
LVLLILVTVLWLTSLPRVWKFGKNLGNWVLLIRTIFSQRNSDVKGSYQGNSLSRTCMPLLSLLDVASTKSLHCVV